MNTLKIGMVTFEIEEEVSDLIITISKELSQLRVELTKSQEVVERFKEQDIELSNILRPATNRPDLGLVGMAKYLVARAAQRLKGFESAEAKVKELELQLIAAKPMFSRRQVEATAQRYREALEEIAVYKRGVSPVSVAGLRSIAEQALTEPTKLNPGERDPRD